MSKALPPPLDGCQCLDACCQSIDVIVRLFSFLSFFLFTLPLSIVCFFIFFSSWWPMKYESICFLLLLLIDYSYGNLHMYSKITCSLYIYCCLVVLHINLNIGKALNMYFTFTVQILCGYMLTKCYNVFLIIVFLLRRTDFVPPKKVSLVYLFLSK